MYPLMANPMGQRPMNPMLKADGDGGLGGNVDPGMGGGNVTRPDPFPVQGGPYQGPPAENMPNPLPPGTPPINPDPSQGGGGNSSGLPDWLMSQLGNFKGVLSNPALIPSLTAAFQQYRQAHQYTDMAEGYAGQLNPFGSQRGHYQDLLRQSYDDPTSVLQDPAYQKQLKFELGNLAIQDGGKGWGGSGNMLAALSDRQQNMDEQHIQDYRQGLQGPSGANIGPMAAASMLQTGLLGRMGAENNAIGNLMVPFSNQNANNRSPGGGTGGQANGGTGNFLQQATNLLKNPGSLPAAMRSWNPQQLSQWLQQNNPLGNDSFGTWASGNTGADGGYNPGNIILPGQGYNIPGAGGAPSFGGDGGMGGGGLDYSGGGGGMGDPFGAGSGIDFSGLGSGFADGGFDPSILDPSFFDFGGFP